MPPIPKRFNPHPFSYHQELEVTIESLTNLGLGITRVDGWVVMVPFVCVGERVRVRVWCNHATYSQADLVAVLEPSASRITPRCALFGRCGGCQYQHLSYAHQLELKRTQLAEIYSRLAGLSVEVLPTLPSPLQWGYRTKLTPHYAPPRKPFPDEPAETFCEFPIGFLPTAGRTIIDVAACPIGTAAINAALPALRAATAARQSTIKRDGTLLLRESVTPTGVEVITDFRATARESIGGVQFEFIAGEFFQVNRSILADFSDYILSHLSTPFLVDAYCGVGFFALLAARRCTKVLGVEVNEAAIAKARTNTALNQFPNVEFLGASAEAIFQKVTFPAADTTVIMDPPRAGASADFLSQLIAFGPARVIYVACDPATQARDVKILASGGYRLSSLRAADLFPHTRHIEAIAVLDKK